MRHTKLSYSWIFVRDQKCETKTENKSSKLELKTKMACFFGVDTDLEITSSFISRSNSGRC